MIKDRIMMQEAAGKLGIKDEAIREPVQRTVLEHDKGPDGRVYASLDGIEGHCWTTVPGREGR